MKGYIDMRRLVLLYLSVLFSITGYAVNVIPHPFEYEERTDMYHTLSPDTRIVAKPKGLAHLGSWLSMEMSELLGYEVPVAKRSRNAVMCGIDRSLAIGGSYYISVSSQHIALYGADEQGLFYGMQTLLQQLTLTDKNRNQLPLMLIDDHPYIAKRGVRINAKSVEQCGDMERYVRILARNKLNYMILSSEHTLSMSELDSITAYAKQFFVTVMVENQLVEKPELVVFNINADASNEARVIYEFGSKRVNGDNQMVLLDCQDNPLTANIILSSFAESVWTQPDIQNWPSFMNRWYELSHGKQKFN